jgi:hypothetical protein
MPLHVCVLLPSNLLPSVAHTPHHSACCKGCALPCLARWWWWLRPETSRAVCVPVAAVSTGSDLIYNKAGAWALPRVLATLMKPPQDQHQPTQWQLQQQQQPEQLLVSGSCQPSITCGNSTGGVQQQGRCCSKSRLLAGRQRSQPCGPVMYYAHTKHR